jgi:small, acid-soluble spore protein I
MNFDLRNAIIQNVSGNTKSELRETIIDAIQVGEEKMLPGLGVLFEIIWKHSDPKEQQQMLDALKEGLSRS